MRSQLVFLAEAHGGSGDLAGPATLAFNDLESRGFEKPITGFRSRTFSCSWVWDFQGGRHSLPRGSPLLPARGLHRPNLEQFQRPPDSSVPSSTQTKSTELGGHSSSWAMEEC